MSKQKSVFVVHGRNKQAKNSIFTFLRTIGLEPIDWTKAVSLTGKASPYVMDIVRAGMEHAQCAVILFTPDDIAKLRWEFGSETFAFQPRPNVYLEAGMMLGLGGQERTIIVNFDKLRPITDLEGISIQLLNNESESRKALVNRLITAGCEVNESGSDYLSPATGGDFQLKYDSSQASNSTFERGGFTEYVVDSSISHSLNITDLNNEIHSYLRSGTNVDLKFNYLGGFCASNWLALTDDPSYGHVALANIIKDSLHEIIEKCNFDKSTDVDFISLGPGDGFIDKDILYHLQARATLCNYYPLDISFELLQKATGNVLATSFLQKNFKIKAIHGDFMELIRYKPIYGYDESINFFSLLGYTLGNHNEAELIGKFREGMLTGDFLFLDARLHSLSSIGKLTPADKDAIKLSYQKTNRFSFGVVESMTIANFNDATFDNEVSRNYTVVPEAINLVTYCTNLNTKYRHDGKTLRRDRVNLSLTTVYSFDKLRDWFDEKGFDVVWNKKVRDTGLFLLRKNS